MRQGKPRIKHPLATVMAYGPNDRTVTKLVVSVIPSERDDEIAAMERWVGTDVATSDATAKQMHAFMKANGVKTVSTATVIMGCPHEESEDFPHGEDCPFCPFWAGMQGSGTDDSRWDRLKSVRVERLGPKYRFWLP